MTSVAPGLRTAEGITIVGEATRDAAPEGVELFLEVRTTAPTAALALQDNTVKAKEIGQAIKIMSSGQGDCQQGGTAVWPILPPMRPFAWLPAPPALPLPAYGSFGPTLPVGPSLPMVNVVEGPPIIGYEAVSSLKITLQDPNRVGEMVDSVAKLGANLAVAIRFLRRDEATIRRALLEEAVRETRQTADKLAAAAGRTAGNAVSICEEFAAYSEHSNGNGTLQKLLPVALTGRPSGAPPPLKYYARVSVTYQIQ